MGWPGEDYGDQLLRIVLKPEAWILIVDDAGAIALIDMNNQLVPFADAVEHPERIGALFFYKVDVTGNGTFERCSGGYREFIVGNEAMIEEWSLGTQQIRDQLAADADRLEGFLEQLRPNPPGYDPASFNTAVACEWASPASDPVSSYMHSLSIPSEYYTPGPSELATLIDTLRANLFDPDPLIVKPGGS
jgi:hypothetical protein